MKKEKKSKTFIQTIKERGPTLPIGIVDPSGSSLHKDIKLRPWRMKEERELGELRDKHKDSTIASYISMVLGTMCTKLGCHDFSNISLDQKRLIIGQMYMADVFYAYVWLRINSLGADFPVTFNPPWSNQEIKIAADLNSVETACAKEIKDIHWNYKLVNPITMRGKEITEFKMTQQRWYSLESINTTNSTNQTITKQSFLLASIMGCKELDEDIAPTSQELDELTKLDLERLSFLIDDKALGPKMVIEGSHNGREFTTPIDWGYDNFFAVSSV